MIIRILLIYSLLITSLNTWAVTSTTLPVDQVSIGKQGSTSNKSVKFKGTSQEIRANTSINKLEYTNDGVTYKPIGSGSGAGASSGVNLVTNDSFEDPITTGWTSSGGTFSQHSYTNGIESDAKYFRFVATTSGQYFETASVVIPDNFSGGCQADFKKLNISTDDLFKVEVLDVSSNVLTSANIKKSSWVKFPTLSFKCPSAGSTVKMRVTSLAAGTLEGDRGYVGSSQNIVQVTQARLVGTIKWSATASCLWQTTSTSFVSSSATSACPSPIVSGAVSAPGTKVPVAVLNNAQPGEYLVIHRGSISTAGSTAVRGYVRPTDGTNFDIIMATGANSPGYESSAGTIVSRFSYSTAQASLNFQLQMRTESVNTPVSINAQAADYEIDVYYYPLSGDYAVTNEQASWFIDANIGGADINLGTSVLSTYSEINSSSIDMVLNTGSASAKIACASGTASVGLSCNTPAVSESLGVTFTPPYSGRFEACFDFTHYLNPSGIADITFQIVETSDTATSIISEGNSRQGSSSSANVNVGANTIRLCGDFNFSDTSPKTLRVMREQSGLLNDSRIIADRSASNGQRDIHVTIKPSLSSHNRPILTGDQVTSTGSDNTAVFSAQGNGAGLLSNKKGVSFFNGDCSYSSNSFNCPVKNLIDTPNCTVSHTGTTNDAGIVYVLSGSTSTNLRFVVFNGSGLGTNQPFNFICHGTKNN